MIFQGYYIDDFYILLGIMLAGMIGSIFFAIWLGTKYN